MNKPANFLQWMQSSSLLFGSNAPFVEELYEKYLVDPNSISEEWQAYFDALPPLANGAHDELHSRIQQSFAALPKISHGPFLTADAELERKQVFVLQLINAYRFLGVRVANLDPLSRFVKPVVAELDPAHYGLGETDMNTTFETGSLVGGVRMTLREILKLLRQTYCSSIGAEYMYIGDVTTKRWLQNRLESSRGEPGYDAATRRRILERITAAETLERYLHTKFVGQ